MKFIFSYQEKILRCSILVFHILKTLFRNVSVLKKEKSQNSNSRSIQRKVKTHLKKTTFSNEKKSFSTWKDDCSQLASAML